MQTVKQYVTIAPPPVTPAPSPVEAEDHRPARAARSQHAQGTPVSGSGLVPSPPAPFEPPTTTLPDTTDPQVLLAPQVLLPLESGSVSEGALALPPAVSRAESVVFGDTTIYTKASPDVQPPVLYSPKLPPVPPSEPDLLGTNTMELLIDETGTVQQALLKSRPVRLSDMMLLSPAKTWKFHPALKDGHPVKYRLTLSWVVAPP
jgi:hypothetical protein